MADPRLFELQHDPSWGYEERMFLDNEHRYTKMHRLLTRRYGSVAGKRVLDLGCSRGQFLARFQDEGADVQGTEIDPAEIEYAERRGIAVERGFIEPADVRLPFGDDEFDVVLAGEIIEHMVDSEGFLREIARVLRPGGALVLSTPNVLWWKHRLVMLAGRYPDVLDYRLRYGRDFGHVRAFTPAIVRELLESAGYEDVEVVGKRLGPLASLMKLPGPAARGLDRLADRLPTLSDHVIAFGRAPRSTV